MLSKIAVAMSLVALSFVVPGAVATVAAGDPGVVVVAMGGGSLEDAQFLSFGDLGEGVADATFSFQVGCNKHGDLKGSFWFKRLYPGSEYENGGIRGLFSTEITTLFPVTVEENCLVVEMWGEGTWIHNYWPYDPDGNKKPKPDHTFLFKVWDCDGTNSPDMVWWEVYKPGDFPPDDDPRWAGSLANTTTELTHGNIMIRDVPVLECMTE